MCFTQFDMPHLRKFAFNGKDCETWVCRAVNGF